MRSGTLRVLVWVLGPLALAGCAGRPQQAPDPPKSQAVAPAVPVQSPPPVTSPAAKPTAIPRRKPLFNLDAIVGREEAEVRRLLGEPAVVNEDPPGKSMRYYNGNCAVWIALYPDVTTRTFHVLSYEVTSDDGNNATDRTCRARFAALAAERQ